MSLSISKVIEELNNIKADTAELSKLITKPDVLHLLRSVENSNSANESPVFGDAVDALIDISWEECNVGHWSDVPEPPKFLYAYANFLKVLLRLRQAKSCEEGRTNLLKEAVAAADLGLMLGKGYEAQLTRAATLITELLGHDKPEELPSHSEQTLTKKEWTSDEYFNEKLNATHVLRAHCPSLEEFSLKHFFAHTPVLLSGCISHWPALKRWNDLDYLIRVAGPRTVPVEIGSSYTQTDWGMELTTLQDFIIKHVRGNAPKTGYLAQHQLFDQIPELKKDIIVPDYCCLTEKDDDECQVDINAWFGPANTLTPLHYDPKHNLLCQIVGSKRIILYCPEDSPFLHPHDESMLNNTAKIDPYNPDRDRFPDFDKATAFYCKLQPGEMLYIPPKWWHHVVSLDVSFSVSFWWE